jgi:IclR family acetate operon transcriptional repressor
VYPIASVDNALRLLLLFRDRQVVRLTEASKALGVAQSTAHRLLAMLQLHEFVRQDPDTRAYVAGSALLDVGLAAVRDLDAAWRIRPYLQVLSAEVEETAHLCVLRGTNVVFVDSVESTRPVRTGSRVGVSLPAHCTSAGKVLLAGMPPEALALLYPDRRLVGLTRRSLTRLADLEHELGVVRERGWAANVGESESDIAGVAVAIATPTMGPRAALAVSAPLERLPQERMEHVAAVASRVAAGLARIDARPDAPAS